MHREQEIAEEQRVARHVGDDEIVVGMGGRLRLEEERAAAEIEGEGLLDAERRQDHLDALEGFVAEHLPASGEIAVGPRGEPARELVMPDKGGIILLEGRIAEYMVGMHMRVDHVFDRLVGYRADGVPELAPGDGATQGVDYRDGLIAHDEARIGHVPAIFRRLQLVAALMHQNARRDLAHFKPEWRPAPAEAEARESSPAQAPRAGNPGG